jgi:hypothetical protein
MTTFTTDFAAPPLRSRAERLNDGVVAKYIHELISASGRPARGQAAGSGANGSASYATSPAKAGDTAAEASPYQARDEGGVPRRSSCWSRGGRLTRSTLAQRLAETR